VKKPCNNLKSLPCGRTSRPRPGLTTERTALFATTSPTFATVAFRCRRWRVYAKAALGPTRANVAYPFAIPPVTGASRKLAARRPAGTGPGLTTVCFACPVFGKQHDSVSHH